MARRFRANRDWRGSVQAAMGFVSSLGPARRRCRRILSHGFWQREFAGDPGVGRTVNLDGNPFTIVGVTPRDFFGVRVGFTFDVMIPLGSEPIIRGVDSALDRRSTWWLSMFGRLAPGQTMAAGRSAARGAAAATA